MMKAKRLGIAGITAALFIGMALSIAIGGCFKHSKDEDISGSSVPAPGAFTLGTPVDGAINIDIAAAEIPASWTASTDVATYSLDVCKDDSFVAANSVYSTTLASNVTLYNVPTATLAANMWYYWRVTATNAGGSAVASNAPFSFYTGSSGAAPGTFNLSSPADNASGLSLTPELAWTNAASETMYTAYLDDNSGFATPYTATTKAGVLNAAIPGSAALTDTTRYYWKVEASNTVTTTVTTSTIYSFVTGPIEYYLITPTATTITAGQSITFTFTAYGTDDAQVITHTAFIITMTGTSGLVFYTDNTLVTPTTTYTLANGTASIYCTITASGSAVITATDIAGRVKSSSGTVITVNPGTASSLAFVAQPQTITAGNNWAAVTVSVKDQYNNNVPGASVSVTTTNGTGLNGALTQSSDSGGIATFSPLSMTLVGASYALSAASGALTATSAAFDITPAAAGYLKVTGTATMNAGDNNELTVTAYDAYSNTATGYAGDKNLIFTGPNQSLLSDIPKVEGVDVGEYISVTFVAGVSTAGSCTLVAYLAETVSVDALDGTISSAGSASYDLDLTVNGATATHFFVNGSDTTITAGGSTELTVIALDQYANTATGYAGSKTITFTGPSTIGSYIPQVEGVDVGTPMSVPFVAGVSSASSCTLVAYAAESGAPLVHAGDGTINSYSAGGSGWDLAVNPAAANKLAFTTQPTNTAVDTAFSPAVVVEVQDVYSNTVTTASNVITLTIGGQPISLGGAFSATASGGVATFTGVTVGGTSAPGYVLYTANDDALTEDTSAAFTLTGFGALDSYLVGVTVNPIGSGVTGTGTATAKDIYGNTVTTAATTLTMTKTDGLGSPTVTFYTAGDATGTVNNVYSTWSSGVLTFYYTATGTAGWDFTITATDVGLKTGTSVTITIN